MPCRTSVGVRTWSTCLIGDIAGAVAVAGHGRPVRVGDAFGNEFVQRFEEVVRIGDAPALGDEVLVVEVDLVGRAVRRVVGSARTAAARSPAFRWSPRRALNPGTTLDGTALIPRTRFESTGGHQFVKTPI